MTTTSSSSFPVPVYCLHLKDRPDRLSPVLQTAARHGFADRLQWIDAVTPVEAESFLGEAKRHSKILEYACLFSHRRALEKIVTDKSPMALVMEDDAVFRNDLRAMLLRLGELFANKQWTTTLLLSPEVESWDAIETVLKFETPYPAPGKEKEKLECELCTVSAKTWSAASYLVTYEAAVTLLKKLEREWPDHRITSETEFIQSDKSRLLYPPLAIESLSPSSISPNEQYPSVWEKKREYWGTFSKLFSYY